MARAQRTRTGLSGQSVTQSGVFGINLQADHTWIARAYFIWLSVFVLFVVAVFALQVVASRWWLARFRYGPMEWLWRAATYLRLPPMRR